MWLDSEVYVSDGDYERFKSAGLDDAKIKAEVAKLSSKYMTPLSDNPDFDFDEYLLGLDDADEADLVEDNEEEPEKETPDAGEGNNSDKKAGDPASDSGDGKHASPEGKASSDSGTETKAPEQKPDAGTSNT
jgi:hypothetical protein